MRRLSRRLGFYILAFWFGVTVAFIIPRAVPGDPVAVAVADASATGGCNAYCAQAIEKEFGTGPSSTVQDSPKPTRTSFAVYPGEGGWFDVGSAVSFGSGGSGVIKSISGDVVTLTKALSQPPQARTGVSEGTQASEISQYFTYLGNVVRGNLGNSWSESDQPVMGLIGSYLPWTLGLLAVGTVIAFVLGTVIGILMAWLRGSFLDWVAPAATFFQAVPYFFLAQVAVVLLGRWFPTSGGYDASVAGDQGFNWPYISSIIGHAFLPALTVVLASVAGFLLGMRNQMITTMDEDYVLVARAKGLHPARVVWYAARNAMLPSISNFTIALSLVVAGQFLVEFIFSYPGIGFHLFDALSKLDYTLVQGIFIVVIAFVLVANLLADVVYVFIDPRARQEG